MRPNPPSWLIPCARWGCYKGENVEQLSPLGFCEQWRASVRTYRGTPHSLTERFLERYRQRGAGSQGRDSTREKLKEAKLIHFLRLPEPQLPGTCPEVRAKDCSYGRSAQHLDAEDYRPPKRLIYTNSSSTRQRKPGITSSPLSSSCGCRSRTSPVAR